MITTFGCSVMTGLPDYMNPYYWRKTVDSYYIPAGVVGFECLNTYGIYARLEPVYWLDTDEVWRYDGVCHGVAYELDTHLRTIGGLDQHIIDEDLRNAVYRIEVRLTQCWDHLGLRPDEQLRTVEQARRRLR